MINMRMWIWVQNHTHGSFYPLLLDGRTLAESRAFTCRFSDGEFAIHTCAVCFSLEFPYACKKEEESAALPHLQVNTASQQNSLEQGD